MIKFNTLPSLYWSKSSKISYLQRQVLLMCIAYYDLDESYVTDMQYDSISKQLVEMQNSATEKEMRKTTYHHVFYDFEGSTGFNLISRLSDEEYRWLRMILTNILNARR